MRKLLFAALVFSLLATVSRAQETPVADVAAGYSFLYVVKGLPNWNTWGFERTVLRQTPLDLR